MESGPWLQDSTALGPHNPTKSVPVAFFLAPGGGGEKKLGPSRSEEGSQLGTSIEKTERQVPAGRQASVVGGIGGLFTGQWLLRPRFFEGSQTAQNKKTRTSFLCIGMELVCSNPRFRKTRGWYQTATNFCTSVGQIRPPVKNVRRSKYDLFVLGRLARDFVTSFPCFVEIRVCSSCLPVRHSLLLEM